MTLSSGANNLDLRQVIQRQGRPRETFIALIGHPETNPALLLSERAVCLRRASDWGVAGTGSDEVMGPRIIPADQSRGDSWLVFKSEDSFRVVRVDLSSKKPISSSFDIAETVESLIPGVRIERPPQVDKSGPNIRAFIKEHIRPGERFVTVIGHYPEELTPEVAMAILQQRKFEDVAFTGDAIEPKVQLRLVVNE